MRGPKHRVQLKGLLLHGPRCGARIAPGKARAIVTADARKLRDVRLDPAPIK